MNDALEGVVVVSAWSDYALDTKTGDAVVSLNRVVVLTKCILFSRMITVKSPVMTAAVDAFPLIAEIDNASIATLIDSGYWSNLLDVILHLQECLEDSIVARVGAWLKAELGV